MHLKHPLVSGNRSSDCLSLCEHTASVWIANFLFDPAVEVVFSCLDRQVRRDGLSLLLEMNPPPSYSPLNASGYFSRHQLRQ